MYALIKKISFFILPKNLIKKNESLFRSILAIKYIGSKYQCNICEFKMSSFLPYFGINQICPKCGSMSRTRKLWELIKPEIGNKSILHFSPPQSLSIKIKEIAKEKYITTDYDGEFKATKKYDITNIDASSNSFDLIICYHILEHIENDHKAISELYRILKPNGQCFIQTPFKIGETFEDRNAKTPEERFKVYGQDNHVRLYSANDLKTRLEKHGFKTQIKTYTEEKNNIYGYKLNETVLIARKK
jgi:SAM-dependent methyltransferase